MSQSQTIVEQFTRDVRAEVLNALQQQATTWMSFEIASEALTRLIMIHAQPLVSRLSQLERGIERANEQEIVAGSIVDGREWYILKGVLPTFKVFTSLMQLIEELGANNE